MMPIKLKGCINSVGVNGLQKTSQLREQRRIKSLMPSKEVDKFQFGPQAPVLTCVLLFKQE